MKERTVVITGAAGAIGAVVAQRFAGAGWRLGLVDYGEDRAASLRGDFPDAHAVSADLTDIDAAQGAIDAIEENVGPVDALLNIAGGFAMQPADEATDDDLAKMHRLNMVTLFNATRAVLPSMQERGGGFVLGVSAAAALEGASGAALYAAGKAAVAAYLKSLHAELRTEGIRTSVIYPMGVVDTEANREAMPEGDPETWISRDEIAESMLHLSTRSARGHVRELKIFAPSVDP
jgi:NADP-dependent 3-hydroxy acid dehydrogenase YdfG